MAERVRPTPEQKRRNMWLALALVSFVVLIGIVTALKLSQGTYREAERLAAESEAPQ